MTNALGIALSIILLGGFAGMMTAFWIYYAKHVEKKPKNKKK